MYGLSNKAETVSIFALITISSLYLTFPLNNSIYNTMKLTVDENLNESLNEPLNESIENTIESEDDIL